MVELTDTHCHVQFPDYPLDAHDTIADAFSNQISRLLLVGCTLPDSEAAIQLAGQFERTWATIGLHPHEGSIYTHDEAALQRFRDLATKPKVVAIGETGLDFYYNHSSRTDQIKLLRFQLELGIEHNLPFIFHIREAFDEFWQILDEYKGIRGVVHSFSSSPKDLEAALSRGLYIGLNGIMTFTKVPEQLEAAKSVPADRMLLETDAPFLTPKPFRGKICVPKHVIHTAQFLADLRGETIETLAEYTTDNAKSLFGLV